MSNKDILIIGAGEAQVSIIEVAKKEGFHTIVASPVNDEPGVKIADEYFDCDIYDIEKLVQFGKEREIGGVLTDQSDKATPVVAKVAELLNLPGFGYENALIFTDKAKMREVFVKIGLPVAENYTTSSVEEAQEKAEKIRYPVVIKPVDSFASRGVYIVSTKEQLTDKYAVSYKISKSHKVIVEKYIEGPQYFSQGYVQNGELCLFAFSDRYYFNVPEVCLPYTNAFPALIDQTMKDRMTDEFSKVINYLNPSFGQVWAEWIYDEATDELYIIEMAIRGAGALVTTDIITNAYGIDTQRFLVHDAMGDHQDWFSQMKPGNKAAAFFCFLVPPGRVIKCEGIDKIFNIPGVVKASIKAIHVGDITDPYKDKHSRFGPIVVKGDTRSELEEIKKKLIKTIDIQVMTEDGIKMPIWE